MSPSPNQFPQSSSGSDQVQTGEPVIRRPNPPRPAVTTPPTPAPAATSPAPAPAANAPTPGGSDAHTAGVAESPARDSDRRQEPIPPPSEPMQYRAIGLVRGKYFPSADQFTRGALLASDDHAIDAVLLGRIMSLVKNHLDLESEHLWVVYPRTRLNDDALHVQIVGVWEPEKLDKTLSSTDEEATEPTETSSPKDIEPQSLAVEDGYFSIRGEVVYQSLDEEKIVVKIRQAARKDEEKPKFFKLTLNGVLQKKAVGYFWEFHIQRQANNLLIKEAKEIAVLSPKKPRKPFKGGGRPGGKKPWQPPHTGNRPAVTGGKPPEKPIPRPTKRPQPSNGE
ncbi:hypothetical protein [Argonema antarcticum]|uniref:hypothetical protein n=1 Tax=Argonema antarcticum TaxID=2942763 RepID=UPI002012A6A4|nr:hypothetical protein [Argonema antarcticum]MCL1469321.1 hypothetical protein [Argonema antarcticum A004/B2]